MESISGRQSPFKRAFCVLTRKLAISQFTDGKAKFDPFAAKEFRGSRGGRPPLMPSPGQAAQEPEEPLPRRATTTDARIDGGRPRTPPCARALSRDVRDSVRRNRQAAQELEELLPRRATADARLAGGRPRTPPVEAKTPPGRGTPETQTTAGSGYYTSFHECTQAGNDSFQRVEAGVESLGSMTQSSPWSNRFLGNFLGMYRKFKAMKTKKNRGRCQGALEDVQFCRGALEDVQFCGLYFCGVDVFCEDDEREEESDYDILKKNRKQQRKEETEELFLGKIIQFGSTECWCGN